ncbi:DUF3419 family protein [bacterium]|nr:MAG: DUF3419 family protein [bacterium]
MNTAKTSLWSRGTLGGKLLPPRERILFGAVHEDAEIERLALQARRAALKSQQPMRAFSIASGGCTAISLLLEPDVEVVAVDVNPAQIYLCELKKAVLSQIEAATPLGNATVWFDSVEGELSPQAQEFWRSNRNLLRTGLNGCGLTERVMRTTACLWKLWLGPQNMEALMTGDFSALRDPRWRLAFRWALHHFVLRLFYARGYISSLPPGFSREIRRRIERSLTRFPIAQNPYIQLTLRGQYGPNEISWPTYWQSQHRGLLRSRLSNLSLHTADAASFLESQPPQSFDFFALSNVLEVCSPSEQKRLLAAVARAAKPGALVCIRAILTRSAPQRWPTAFEVDERLTRQLLDRDRSPICPLWAVLRRR